MNQKINFNNEKLIPNKIKYIYQAIVPSIKIAYDTLSVISFYKVLTINYIFTHKNTLIINN